MHLYTCTQVIDSRKEVSMTDSQISISRCIFVATRFYDNSNNLIILLHSQNPKWLQKYRI